MAQIMKTVAGRAQQMLQVAAKQQQFVPRFYSAAGKLAICNRELYSSLPLPLV